MPRRLLIFRCRRGLPSCRSTRVGFRYRGSCTGSTARRLSRHPAARCDRCNPAPLMLDLRRAARPTPGLRDRSDVRRQPGVIGAARASRVRRVCGRACPSPGAPPHAAQRDRPSRASGHRSERAPAQSRSRCGLADAKLQSLSRRRGRQCPPRIGPPDEILWFAQGRPATRAEVGADFDKGLPLLREMAQRDGLAAETERQIERARERFLPLAS